MCIGMILLDVEYSRMQIDFVPKAREFTSDSIISANRKVVKGFLNLLLPTRFHAFSVLFEKIVTPPSGCFRSGAKCGFFRLPPKFTKGETLGGGARVRVRLRMWMRLRPQVQPAFCGQGARYFIL